MSETVTIGGREFRIGSWYGPKKGSANNRKLEWVGKIKPHWAVDVRYLRPDGQTRLMSAASWSQWAGEEVPDA